MGDTLKTALRVVMCMIVGVVVGTLSYYEIINAAAPPTLEDIQDVANNSGELRISDQKETLERSRRSSVQVLSAAPDHSLAAQSGTYVRIFGRYFVVTTSHGLLGDCEATKIFVEDELHNCVYFTEFNPHVDYAIIEVEKLPYREPLQIPDDIPVGPTEWKKELSIMNRVFYTGYPNSVGPLTLEGRVAGYDGDDYVFLDSYAWSGSSGAGVFSQSGRYIGYVIAIDVGQTHYGLPQIIENIVLVVPAFKINWESARTLPPPDTGRSVLEVPETFDTANYSIVE